MTTVIIQAVFFIALVIALLFWVFPKSLDARQKGITLVIMLVAASLHVWNYSRSNQDEDAPKHQSITDITQDVNDTTPPEPSPEVKEVLEERVEEAVEESRQQNQDAKSKFLEL